MPLFGGKPPAAAKPARSLTLSDEQKLHWLRLIRTPRVGPATFWRLVNYCGGAEAAIALLPDLMRRGRLAEPLRPMSRGDAEAELQRALRLGARLVARGEEGYPTYLAHVELPPPLLYVKGRTDLAARSCVAIVGSRNASVVGEKYTRLLASELGHAGLVIVSGLARGIDAAAHRAGLATGTIAMIAGGIGNVYPPQNRELQEQIAVDGLLVSESPPDHEPRAQDFPRRNRLIAGAGLATLVIEASLNSGSLITARLAAELGRDVMAVPGHPLDPRAAGCNRLLRNGASIITSAADVLEALAPVIERERYAPPALDERDEVQLKPDDFETATDARTRLLDLLGPHPVSIDDIIRTTALPAGTVRAHLLLLELDGLIVSEGAQMVRRNPGSGA